MWDGKLWDVRDDGKLWDEMVNCDFKINVKFISQSTISSTISSSTIYHLTSPNNLWREVCQLILMMLDWRLLDDMVDEMKWDGKLWDRYEMVDCETDIKRMRWHGKWDQPSHDQSSHDQPFHLMINHHIISQLTINWKIKLSDRA